MLYKVHMSPRSLRHDLVTMLEFGREHARDGFADLFRPYGPCITSARACAVEVGQIVA